MISLSDTEVSVSQVFVLNYPHSIITLYNALGHVSRTHSHNVRGPSHREVGHLEIWSRAPFAAARGTRRSRRCCSSAVAGAPRLALSLLHTRTRLRLRAPPRSSLLAPSSSLLAGGERGVRHDLHLRSCPGSRWRGATACPAPLRPRRLAPSPPPPPPTRGSTLVLLACVRSHCTRPVAARGGDEGRVLCLHHRRRRSAHSSSG